MTDHTERHPAAPPYGLAVDGREGLPEEAQP
jgi:hypothetical protein